MGYLLDPDLGGKNRRKLKAEILNERKLNQENLRDNYYSIATFAYKQNNVPCEIVNRIILLSL